MSPTSVATESRSDCVGDPGLKNKAQGVTFPGNYLVTSLTNSFLAFFETSA